MKGRPWTAAELEALHRRYPTEGPALLAREFGRTSRTVKQQAVNHGIRCNSKVDLPRAVELWRAGHSTPEIGRQLGCSSSAIYHALVRAGEAGPGITTGRQVGTQTPAWKRWARDAGYKNLVHRRKERWAYVSELEWSGCGMLGPGQRRLLTALDSLGTATTQEIGEKTGLKWNPRKGGKHLSDLLRGLLARGLVAQAGRRVNGRHGRPMVWTLAGPAAEAARTQTMRRSLE